MASVWSYEGTKCVVTGGGGAGMGAAVVKELSNLGAEIHVLDLREPPVEVASYQNVDLLDPDSTAKAIDGIGVVCGLPVRPNRRAASATSALMAPRPRRAGQHAAPDRRQQAASIAGLRRSSWLTLQGEVLGRR